jgi:hypothetical protein
LSVERVLNFFVISRNRNGDIISINTAGAMSKRVSGEGVLCVQLLCPAINSNLETNVTNHRTTGTYWNDLQSDATMQ